ncbi:hypothetical protein C4573_01935 [Candidatus Woesearchaeota archaeon]|nr:MAG: hypothetical protein C4573_01935 [Candidatus Woesearchaeota archaeon]
MFSEIMHYLGNSKTARSILATLSLTAMAQSPVIPFEKPYGRLSEQVIESYVNLPIEQGKYVEGQYPYYSLIMHSLKNFALIEYYPVAPKEFSSDPDMPLMLTTFTKADTLKGYYDGGFDGIIDGIPDKFFSTVTDADNYENFIEGVKNGLYSVEHDHDLMGTISKQERVKEYQEFILSILQISPEDTKDYSEEKKREAVKILKDAVSLVPKPSFSSFTLDEYRFLTSQGYFATLYNNGTVSISYEYGRLETILAENDTAIFIERNPINGVADTIYNSDQSTYERIIRDLVPTPPLEKEEMNAFIETMKTGGIIDTTVHSIPISNLPDPGALVEMHAVMTGFPEAPWGDFVMAAFGEYIAFPEIQFITFEFYEDTLSKSPTYTSIENSLGGLLDGIPEQLTVNGKEKEITSHDVKTVQSYMRGITDIKEELIKAKQQYLNSSPFK